MVQFYLDPAPPAYLMATVGRLLAFWQTIEASIETSIWGLSGLNETKGRALTAHMTFPLRCDALRMLYHDRYKNRHADKALSKLIENHLKPAQQFRAKYAHALWLKDEDGKNYLLQKDERAKPYVRPELMTKEMLVEDATKLRHASERWHLFLIGEIVAALAEELPSALFVPPAQDALFAVERYLRPTIPDTPQLPLQS